MSNLKKYVVNSNKYVFNETCFLYPIDHTLDHKPAGMDHPAADHVYTTIFFYVYGRLN